MRPRALALGLALLAGPALGAGGLSCPSERAGPAPERGEEATMETARRLDGARPPAPIDAVRPATTEVAVFALG